jgi:predicted membrane chloride channel (bestrophin family)
MIKRMVFMFCVMFPVLLYAEFTGNNSVILAGVTGGVTSGVSVVLFPKDKEKD